MTISSYVRDGLTFDVIDSGPADGDPVVLLHGFPERATCWREVSSILHEAGFRTIAPDQRGYSPGARPRTRLGYGAGQLVEDVVVPTAMVWSDRDVAIGRTALEGNEDSVTGPYEFIELTGVSHWIPTKAPQAAADAILSTIARATRS